MAYVGELIKDKTATRQENLDWLRVYHSNPGTPKAAWAKEKLIRHNQRFVRSVVVKTIIGYPHWQQYFEDICQEAQFGLLRAIEKYDITKGCAFSTYAYAWVRHFAQMGLAQTTSIRKPFSLWEIKRWGGRFEAKFLAEHHRKPNPDEMAEAINASNICCNYVMTPEKYTLMMGQWFNGTLSLDSEKANGVDTNDPLIDYLVDPREHEVETSFWGDWLRDMINDKLPWKLNKQEKRVLAARLDGYPLRLIPEIVGMSYATVRVRNQRMIAKIKHARQQFESGEKPTQYVVNKATKKKPSHSRPSRGGEPKPRGNPNLRNYGTLTEPDKRSDTSPCAAEAL